MSASSKKKLRNAQAAEKLTERQAAEQKEAKKLKFYSVTFVCVLAVLLVIAVTFGIFKTVTDSGMRERNSVAMTVGGEEISAAEMSYFYKEYVQNYANQNSYFLAYMLDVNAPLNQQLYDPTTGVTWADFFVTMTQDHVRSVYALSNAAKAEGYTLTADEQMNLDMTISNLEFYALTSGFSSAKDYLKAIYGPGSSVESYSAYCERVALANSYYSAHADTLTYDDAALREAEQDTFNNYSSYTYHSYYMATSKFLEGGTTDENGTLVYSDEENAAAEAAALEAAKALTDTETITSVEELDMAIGALSINKSAETVVSSALYTNQLHTNIDSAVAEWLGGDHKEGDLAYVARTTENEDGTTSVVGYYILWFISRDDNLKPLANVRHILVSFEGGTTDANGAVTYSEEEKAAARTAAEELLAQWEAGDKSEESFAALATEHTTDPGSAETGGLYENIVPGQMVAAFDEWCFSGHVAGDTGIVETEYGFHVMYYSGDSEMTYRDYMISNSLRTQDMETWYNALLEGCAVVPGETTYLPLSMTMNG